MKARCIAFALIMILIFSMVGCTSKSLPSGRASHIDFVDGQLIYDCEFEYINEHTVKIIRDDGQVIYVPTSNIEKIWVEE